ncbi:MAG: hybrid sensor histidine kinase/response regulator [Pseudonocardiales bacterium]|nr:hybrid sensor histidine kinase/response regulator [Pseudonocardiales bacterium]
MATTYDRVDWTTSDPSGVEVNTVVTTSHDALIGKTVDGLITSWNPGAVNLYGYSREEMIGQHTSRLAHEDFSALESTLLSRAANGEHLEMARSRRLHKSGMILDVLLSISPMMNISGEVIGVMSVSRDVSEAASAYPPSQIALETTADAIVCVDAGGAITLVNDQVERLYGFARVELIGQSVEVLGEATAEIFRSTINQFYELQPTLRTLTGTVHFLAQRKDGSSFAADINLGCVEVSGDLIVSAAIRDATDRIAVQIALQESEALFRQLAESVAVAFLLRSCDPGEYLYVSPGYQKIFGYDPMAANESPIASLGRVHPDDLGRVMAEYWEPSEAESEAYAEYRIIRPNGEVRWVQANATPALGPPGAARRIASIIEDITDRKHVETALQAAAEAEKSNAAKNEFLSRMSHELRTPLNAVLGFAQLLELDDLLPHQRDAVHHILHGGRHLVGLIDDVLDISKIESNRLSISLEAVLISELLEETVALMSPVAASAQVRLIYQSAGSPGRHVLGDNRRLRQVMLNLLSNAIKYNRPSGRVEVQCVVTGDGTLDISVSDTGFGIHADDLPRLFTPFDRLGAQSTGIEGTGVGLALSQRLMTTMGGSLRVISELGVGSTFIARIPLASIEVWPAVPEYRFDEQGTIAGQTEVATKTLLCIEDNNSNVELMERLVSHRPQWRMIVAGHGALGLELALSKQPDLVMLDLHLPDIDGIEVLRRLRADDRTQELKVVVVSADANPNQIKRLLGAGADAYLTKPLSVREVLDLLD